MPTVITDYTTSRELLAGCGTVVAPAVKRRQEGSSLYRAHVTASDMADAVRDLLTDRETYAGYAAEGVRRARERYDSAAVGAQWVALVRGVLEETER